MLGRCEAEAGVGVKKCEGGTAGAKRTTAWRDAFGGETYCDVQCPSAHRSVIQACAKRPKSAFAPLSLGKAARTAVSWTPYVRHAYFFLFFRLRPVLDRRARFRLLDPSAAERISPKDAALDSSCSVTSNPSLEY